MRVLFRWRAFLALLCLLSPWADLRGPELSGVSLLDASERRVKTPFFSAAAQEEEEDVSAASAAKKGAGESTAKALAKAFAEDGYRLLKRGLLPSLLAHARRSVRSDCGVRRLSRAWGNVLLKVQLRGVTNPPAWEEAAQSHHEQLTGVSLSEDGRDGFRAHLNWPIVDGLLEEFEETAVARVREFVPPEMFECERREAEEVEACVQEFSPFVATAFRAALEDFAENTLLKRGPTRLARNLWILTAGSVCPFEAYGSPGFVVLAWQETPTRNIARFVADSQELSVFSPECAEFKRRLASLLRRRGVVFSQSAQLEEGKEALLAVSKRFAVKGLVELAKEAVEELAAKTAPEKAVGNDMQGSLALPNNISFVSGLHDEVSQDFSQDTLRRSVKEGVAQMKKHSTEED